MNGSNSEIVEVGRNRIAQAVENARWDEAAENLFDLLWTLAEIRPDFEELPSWIAEARASCSPDGDSLQPIKAVEKIYSILGSFVNCYGDAADRAAFAQSQSQLASGRTEIPIDEMALFAADIGGKAASFRKGGRRLPLAVYKDELFIGRHTRISFNRTLRIPEDGREYPLPDRKSVV